MKPLPFLDQVPTTMTVRELLRVFGAERRGSNVVYQIRRALRNNDLKTVPDFTDVWIDATIRIQRDDELDPGMPAEVPATPERSEASAPDPPLIVEDAVQEPAQEPAGEIDETAPGPTTDDSPEAKGVLRLGGLRAALRPIEFVRPGTALLVATTKMLIQDFSQLPVLQSERACKGAITWKSIAQQHALGRTPATVDECLEPVEILDASTSLLEAIRIVTRASFVLVRGPSNLLTGIVTTADLSEQFLELSAPFMLIGQIEACLRSLIERRFSPTEIQEAKDPADEHRVVVDASGLSFGEYVHLLQRPESFTKLRLAVEREPFVESLEKVRSIRNDVVHFHTDPLETEELDLLRSFSRFLEFVTRSLD